MLLSLSLSLFLIGSWEKNYLLPSESWDLLEYNVIFCEVVIHKRYIFFLGCNAQYMVVCSSMWRFCCYWLVFWTSTFLNINNDEGHHQINLTYSCLEAYALSLRSTKYFENNHSFNVSSVHCFNCKNYNVLPVRIYCDIMEIDCNW